MLHVRAMFSAVHSHLAAGHMPWRDSEEQARSEEEATRVRLARRVERGKEEERGRRGNKIGDVVTVKTQKE